MITLETAIWLNRIGLILGFLSFWFVAPEFIGESRLRSWELWLRQHLPKTPAALKWIFGLWTALVSLGYVMNWIMTERTDTIPAWVLAVSGILSGTSLLAQIVAPHLVAKLASNRVRQRSLFVGALLFVMSFVLQFAATFQTAAGR